MTALNMTFVYGKTKSVYTKIIVNLIIVCTILYSITILMAKDGTFKFKQQCTVLIQYTI